MPLPIDRRHFLRTTGAGLLVAGFGGGLLSACGGDEGGDDGAVPAGGDGGAAGAGRGEAVMQLSWLKNVQFAGPYLADANGYFTERGFRSVRLDAGGPQVAVEPLVAGGGALVGMSSPEYTAASNLEGADLRIVATHLQRSPFAITSLATDPLPDPGSLQGRRVGVASVNQSKWEAFLGINGLSLDDVTTVPVQFDVAPLTTGDVDAMLTFVTDEPVALTSLGFESESFLLDDFGMPLYAQAYLVSAATLADEALRADAVALLQAIFQGWQDALADPAEAVRVTVEEYGRDLQLDPDQQRQMFDAQVELVMTGDAEEHGIGWMGDERIADNVDTLAQVGLEIDTDALFDVSLLPEIYPDGATTVS